MLVRSFLRAVRQLPDPTFRLVLFIGTLLTVILFILLIALSRYFLPALEPFETFWLSWLNPYLEPLYEATFWIVAVFVLFLLFPSIASLFMSLFLDRIADAVENKHYPNDSPAKEVPALESFSISLQFSVTAIALNLLFLPIYLILFFLPPLNLLVYYGLNGYLFSREYFELVSIRHLKAREMRVRRRAFSGPVFLAGIVIAFMMTIPIINFFAPLIATAFMVHVFKATDRAE